MPPSTARARRPTAPGGTGPAFRSSTPPRRWRRRPAHLPPDWRAYPAPRACAELGTRWIAARSTAMLAVPSAVVPSEPDYLLNPLHADFRRIRVGRPQPFSFDPRLWKRAWPARRGPPIISSTAAVKG